MDRTRTLALLAALPLALAAAPAHAAQPLSHERYDDSFTFEEPDLCGLAVTFDMHARGTFVVRPVNGSDQAFLAHDSYRVTEIISTHEGWIRTERHGQFHEQRGTQVDGDVWAFDFVDSGQFRVFDSSGVRLLQANGVFQAREQFDTLGDGQPGGVPVDGTFEVRHEAGPVVTDEAFCAVVQQELG